MDATPTGAKYHVELHDARGVAIGDNNVVHQYFLDERYRPLAEHIVSFDALITNHVEGFKGRGFVFEELETFLRDHDRGYFVIEGEPGIGKTAIMAKLADRYGYLHHFNVASMGISTTQQFLENISAQLITRYDLGVSRLPPNSCCDGILLSQLLRQVSAKITGRKEKLVILVDALDEVTQSVAGANILCLPPDLPQVVYFVLTVRPAQFALRANVAYARFMLDPSSPENRLDIREYVEENIVRIKLQDSLERLGMKTADFVEAIVSKSEGNFMYLRYILPAIKEDPSYYNVVDKLPQGLAQYYQDHWSRMQLDVEDASWERRIKIIYVLSEAEQAVPIEWISKYTGENSLLVQRTLQKWRPFLDGEVVGGRTLHRIYHASFRDFLRRDDIVKVAGLTLAEINESIADQQLRTLGIDLGESDG